MYAVGLTFSIEFDPRAGPTFVRIFPRIWFLPFIFTWGSHSLLGSVSSSKNSSPTPHSPDSARQRTMKTGGYLLTTTPYTLNNLPRVERIMFWQESMLHSSLYTIHYYCLALLQLIIYLLKKGCCKLSVFNYYIKQHNYDLEGRGRGKWSNPLH